VAETHSESELRGQITRAQKELEEISFRCTRSDHQDAGCSITEAIGKLQEAKRRLVLTDAERRAR